VTPTAARLWCRPVRSTAPPSPTGLTGRVLATSQTRSVKSEEPEAMRVPSGGNAQLSTVPVRASKVPFTVPHRTSMPRKRSGVLDFPNGTHFERPAARFKDGSHPLAVQWPQVRTSFW
jgi:hypothetical protein